MPDIVLTTLNARYTHASLALRYLHANLGQLQADAVIREFTIAERADDVAEEILWLEPAIVGLGVYIWNVALSTEVVDILKRVRPELTVVVGGPEVSHETGEQRITRLADYTICGEADHAFAELCCDVLSGERPRAPILRPPPVDVETLASPYALYTDDDIRDRHIYVEASRGCPFKCEFCLSSLDNGVRNFELEPLLVDLDRLIANGARHLKFIDRTFNLSPRTSATILEFFHERIETGCFAHFEMVPDRLPESLRAIIARFPPGSLQFELGIQTFDDETAARISRRQNVEKLEDNLRFLASETNVHVHADLIVGLPGESEASFAAGFDRLVALGPQEIQVGILKRLRGTPIVRHDDEFEMVYSSSPPYEVLSTADLSFAMLKKLKRFARAWDLVANSGNFRESLLLVWGEGSPYDGFSGFAAWLFERAGHFSGIALDRLTRLLFEFLTDEVRIEAADVGARLARDYTRPGRRLPAFLETYADALLERESRQPIRSGTPKRQARHLV